MAVSLCEAYGWIVFNMGEAVGGCFLNLVKHENNVFQSVRHLNV